MPIILEKEKLRNISDITNCESIEEGKIISKELFKELSNQRTSPAISANQIGISKRVIAISIIEPIYLINPVIIARDLIYTAIESHSSFPNRLFTTIRPAHLIVKADNINGEITFGLKVNQKRLLYVRGQLNKLAIVHPKIMEALYIEQAIDTLNGILPEDKEIKEITPIKKDKLPGRNDKILISKDNNETYIKSKYLNSFISRGWKEVK